MIMVFDEFHSGKSIESDKISSTGNYPVFGGNGIRGYTDTFNQDGDYVIIGRQGAYCGNVHYYSGKSYLTEHAIVGKTKKEYNHVSVAYLLSLLKLYKFQGQSAQPGLSVETLSKITVKHPQYNFYGMGQILSSLDAKIALNRRMNEELEGMAKMLYDYWFVQFDFPNEEGKPYKSSGGAMEYNAVLKREIPAGWKVKSIQEQFDVVMERISKEDTSQSNYAPIEVLPKRRMSFFECAPIESAISGLCKFEKFDVLLSNRRVYFHKVCIAPFAGITRDTVIVLRPLNMERLPYAYQVLNTDHFISYATRHSYGTEQPVFSWDVTRKYYVAESNCSLEGEYSNRMKSLVQKVIGLQHEIKNLTALRDKLLPLLMNGQVRVAD